MGSDSKQTVAGISAAPAAHPGPVWSDFQTDAERVLHQLRAALSEVVAAVREAIGPDIENTPN